MAAIVQMTVMGMSTMLRKLSRMLATRLLCWMPQGDPMEQASPSEEMSSMAVCTHSSTANQTLRSRYTCVRIVCVEMTPSTNAAA